MHAQYADQVDIIGVAGRDDLGSVNGFIENLGVDGFEHIYDETGDIWMEFGIRSQPAFVFIGADGESEAVFGSQGEGGMSERLDALLAAA